MTTGITFFFLLGAISEPVSSVQVTPPTLNLTEFKGSVRLFCSSSGPDLSFTWIDRKCEIIAAGPNLTIANVSRDDHGSYWCNVSNSESFNISDPANVFISYGPDDIQLSVSPSLPEHGEGSNVLLSCSAASRPSAEFKWFLDGEELPNNTKPELRLFNIQTSPHRNYSCQAFNLNTKKTLKSQEVVVSVLERVSNVSVLSESKDLVELRSSVSFLCSAAGYNPHFFWMNNSSEVTASDRAQIINGGATLIISKVTRSDLELLKCHAFNYFSKEFSDPVNISISYGPEKVKLTIVKLQEYYKEGSNIRLTCSADSRPAATFQWLLNGDLLPVSGPELKLINVNINHTGNYSCRAFNNKTLFNQISKPFAISVVESGGVSGGGIAGIIIVCLIVLAAAAAGGYIIFKPKKEVKPEPNTAKTNEENLYETMTEIYEERI